MSAMVSGIIPIFLLIGFGLLLRKRNIFDPLFWENIELLVFYFLFPALLVSSIGSADLGGLEVLPMASVLIGATLVICLGALWIKPQLSISNDAFVSVFQGITRPNTYLGLSMAAALYGKAGIALIAICIVAVIPLVNFLAVIAHLRWADAIDQDTTSGTTPIPWRSALINSLRNPVIMACLIGAVLNLTGIGLPPLVGPTLILAGKAALPLGLMAVGAGLKLATLSNQRWVLVWTTGVKMLVLPFLTWVFCVMFSIEGLSAAICILFAALPVSATSYVMARQMGSDGKLMAGIVTATTIAAAFILPILTMFVL